MNTITLKMNKRCFLFFILQIVVGVSFAQEVLEVDASYIYYAPENVNLGEAKRTALERAKLTAIANTFGTIVSQRNSFMITNQNGESDSRFISLGGSEVKGEWIETTKEPEYKIIPDEKQVVVSVKVSGRIREIVSAAVDITAKILRHGTEEKYEGYEFRSGDDMYLYFKSPVDGYLTVYLLDESSREVFCLLPYRASGDGAYRIEHDKPYVLFSKDYEQTDPYMVDEYYLTCSQDYEYNDIYVIFSPKPFTKAMTIDIVERSETSSDVILPRQLSYEGFQKWLLKLRTIDNSVSLERIPIKIVK